MGKNASEQPAIIEGRMSRDSRGSVAFVNKFKFRGIKRFYVVESPRKGMIRAWHGHKHEAKYVFAVSGAALVGAVKIDNFKNPSRETKVYKFELFSGNPSILYIPAGYANGFKSKTSDTKLVFFSTKTLKESENDDIRFDPDFWDL